jgi:hypothetical protein
MSMSESGPAYGADIYYYFEKKRVKGKIKNAKIRVRLSERMGMRICENDYYWWHAQRVRDGYTFIIRDISKLIKE